MKYAPFYKKEKKNYTQHLFYFPLLWPNPPMHRLILYLISALKIEYFFCSKTIDSGELRGLLYIGFGT